MTNSSDNNPDPNRRLTSLFDAAASARSTSVADPPALAAAARVGGLAQGAPPTLNKNTSADASSLGDGVAAASTFFLFPNVGRGKNFYLASNNIYCNIL